ncbi:MAG: ribbon-helix-helix protein, CopG family [Hahellaceae bacterium]|nr:ribbon-helix-helix protein, CopG family [Hahellaceae bacterium]
MRTIIDLPEEQIEVLRTLSEQSNLSRAELVRRAVAEYLQRHQKDATMDAFGILRDQPVDAIAYQQNLRAEWDS